MKTLWEKEKCCLPAFSPFPIMFSKGLFLHTGETLRTCWQQAFSSYLEALGPLQECPLTTILRGPALCFWNLWERWVHDQWPSYDWNHVQSSYPVPHMPIFGSSNSAGNKDMMSKIIMDKWGYHYWLSRKHCGKKILWEEKKWLVMSNFFFSHNVFKLSSVDASKWVCLE